MQNFFRFSKNWHNAVPTLNRTIILIGIVLFIEAAFFFLNHHSSVIPPIYLSGLMRALDVMVLLLWGPWSFKGAHMKKAIQEAIVVTVIVAAAGFLFLAFLKTVMEAPLPKMRNPSLYYQGTTLIAFYLTACIISPLAEELFFRGLLYRHMRQRCGIWISVLVVSLVFALMHYHKGIGMPFLGSLIFCLGYEKTKFILTPILLHVTGNIILYLLPLIGFV